MSPQKDHQNRATQNTMVANQDLLAPETPAKLNTPSQHNVEADAAGSPLKFISEELPNADLCNPGDDMNNDRSCKKPRKKVYRPKVLGQSKCRTTKKEFGESKTKIKRTYKSQPTTNRSTPKPSTPKQKKSPAARGSPSCKRSFLPLLDEDSVSLPFLENFKAFKVEHGGHEDSTLKNTLGVQYNSLQNYQKISYLSSLCLVESRRIGANFPNMSKKKRLARERPRLEKFLTPFRKGKRSKSFIQKKRCWMVFNSEGNTVINRAMRSLIKRIRSLKKKRGRKNKHKELVALGDNQLVPYKGPKSKVLVALDVETQRVWDLLKAEKGHVEDDENRRKYWEEEREIYRSRVESFMYYMHLIQGDRRFLPWKGSVLDSVVGAFLTQNVSDHLSSSAYMSLAAKFPVKTTSCEGSNEKLEPADRQELFGSSVVFPGPEFNKEIENSKVEEMEVQKAKDSSNVDNKGTENDPNPMTKKPNPPDMTSKKKEKKVNTSPKVDKETLQRWDTLRKIHTKSTRHGDHADSVDWEAVRCAQACEIAKAIVTRGQHNVMAERIQRLLNKLLKSYGSMDLEWLRYAPPKDVKEYLLSMYGIGLKSVECVRLLALQLRAFPVDVNVGRVAVRLGWVPLQPLPEEIQIHNLEKFPDLENIQKYLWPRLCTLDPLTLYQLHYQLITFGKVFCTKQDPNCKACPMRGQCKYFASACASKKIALPPPTPDKTSDSGRMIGTHNSESTFIYEENQSSVTEHHTSKECEPIIEMPQTPDYESSKLMEEEIYYDDDAEEFIIIKLNDQECLSTSQSYSWKESTNNMNISTALVALPADAANIPAPKLKNASRLRTERLVYVLTDEHPLLAKRTPREPDDPSPYLMVVWTTGELESSSETNENSLEEEDDSMTVPGTLLIPCRTAMRGRFPLNGTYFQVNEVFADYASMRNPINVPRKWLWNLEKRVTYFGTGPSSILKGFSLEQIHNCFWKGFICMRAIDAETGAPRPLSYIFHRKTTDKRGKGKKNASGKEE